VNERLRAVEDNDQKAAGTAKAEVRRARTLRTLA
jgi:hypothetical protein